MDDSAGSAVHEREARLELVHLPSRIAADLHELIDHLFPDGDVELVFLRGGVVAAPQKYKLNIAIREQVIDQLVQISGDARGQVYQLEASFTLVDSATGRIIHQGSAVSRAPYSRYQEIFANVRARYTRRTARRARCRKASRRRSQRSLRLR